jgi:hypothetical protein
MTQQKEAPTHWSLSFSHGLRSRPFLSILARSLPVNFNVHTWSVHFVPMIEAVALVHVEARSAGHALAFAEAFVTHLVTHTVRVGGHR